MSKLYRTMLSSAVDAMRAFSTGDLKFKFYYAVALSLEDRLPESNREAEVLQESDEFLVASLLVLVNNMKKTSISDKDEIAKLETQIRTVRKTSSDSALYYAALYLFFVERFDKCKEYIDRALKMSKTHNSDYYLLKGWLELATAKDETGYNLAMKYFEISSKSNDPESLIAKASTFTKLKTYQKALDILDELSQSYPNLLPGYIEKIKINVEINDWESSLELSTKALTIDRHCIDASCYIILYHLIWNFNETQVCLKLNDLASSLEIREPKNARLYYELSKLFSQLAGDNKEICSITFSLIEKTVFIDSKSSIYLCELGHQSVKLDRTVDGERYFQNAQKTDPDNLDVLYGLLLVALRKDDKEFVGQIKELESKYELVRMPIILLYMCALVRKQEKAAFKEINIYLNMIVERHLAVIKDLTLGIKFYSELNVELVLNVTKLYLEYGPVEPIIVAGDKEQSNSVVISSTLIKNAERYLKPVMMSCPGLVEPIYLMARIQYLKGDFNSALKLLDQYIEKSSSFSDALLLKAKILTLQNKTQQASQTLESALSHSFQIRDNIEYTLLRARILKQENKASDSLKMLQNLKSGLSSNQRKKVAITDHEQITLDLMLSELFSAMGKQDESNEIIESLFDRFKGTSHEKRILIANSSIQESLGNIEEAVLILKKIQYTNKQKLSAIKSGKDGTNEFNNELEFYIKSKERLANIYLKYQKDRKLYAKCYEDILEIDPSTESHLMLGNAYLNILEPEKSIEVYEQALKKNPKDALLMRKVGQLYIKIHLYEKAITYLKAGIKSSGYNVLKYDLANLFYQIKRYDDAVEIITNAKELLRNSNKSLEILEFEAKINYLLASIQLELTKREQAIASLNAANAAQTKVMRRLLSENPDSLVSNRTFAIKICTELADQVFAYHRNPKQSAAFLKEALNYDANNNEVLLRLARLELSLSNLEEVHNYCRCILKSSPENDSALSILAEIMFRKNQFDNSLQLLQQILNRKPDNTLALSRLIEATRRCGLLTELVPAAIEKAEKALNESAASFQQTIKLSHCKALYSYHLGFTEDAIRLFIASKNDREFGQDALFKAANLLINPDNDIVGGEVFHSQFEEENSESTQEVSNRMAEKFLNEIQKNFGDSLDLQLMRSFIVFSSKHKNDIESAISNLVKLANEQHEESIKLNYGISTGQMVIKQYSKAKAILKRSSRMNWIYSDAEYFEKSWLLLADIYIQTSKFDTAADLLKRCLLYNKSCIKAYELLGIIQEKEQEYHEATEYYQKAWLLSGEQSTRIGYRLAVCFMKARLFVEAIDICETLLQIEPELKHIKKEILDKSKLHVV